MITTRFTHLTLASPGSDPFYQVGAIVGLGKEKIQPFESIRSIAATSSSALIGLMLALNFKSDSIKSVYEQLYDPTVAHKPGFPRVKIYNQQPEELNAQALRAVINFVLIHRLGVKFLNLTFQQLHNFTVQSKENNFRELYLTANMIGRLGRGSAPEALVFCMQTTPRVSIANAIMAAAATPGVMPTVDARAVFGEDDNANVRFSDGGYVLHEPRDVFYTTKITQTDKLLLQKHTLSILTCAGRSKNMPYEVNPDNRILMQQGAPSFNDQQPNLTHEQIVDMQTVGMNAVKDFYNPQLIVEQSQKLAKSFGNTQGSVVGFGIYSRKDQTIVPVSIPSHSIKLTS